jgi:hypothetical protein
MADGTSMTRTRARSLGGAAALWLLLAAALPAGHPAAPRADAPAHSLEYKVKAGYLFNFAKFIDWPDGPGPDGTGPIRIGLLDRGEAIGLVQPLLEGKQIHGRPVQVRPVDGGVPGRGLHILLVTRAANVDPETLAARLRGSPTLLVGETEDFARRGGMIGFVREQEAIRFTLNLQRATEAGLQVSAKLASVAQVVSSAGKPR